MKNLKDIILEHFENSKFSILERLHVNKDTKEIKPDDPSQWEVGDISKWNVSKVENMNKMFYKSPLEKNPPKWYKK